MVILRQGEHVWLEASSSSQSKVPIGAVVKNSHGTETLVVDDDGKEHWISARNISSVHPMHPSLAHGVEDMIRLGELNEAGIVHNIHIRYKENNIYTYTGSILVAVNPYQELPLYDTEQLEMYRNRRIGELPPHIFALGDTCFFNMQRTNTDQCCVISGESGAGKTESTKLMLQFLASASGQHSWIEQQILEANPIMEAFGNAKTIRNDNSSRFGKYIEIHFSNKHVIEGARIEQFLLEKSRVCRQSPGERNYHIFYCMLLGMGSEQKKQLNLESPSDYKYLTMGNCTNCDGRDDHKAFSQIRTAMKILLLSEIEQQEIFKMLAAILHLGNLKFKAAMCGNLECCDVPESIHLSTVATLLEVDSAQLTNCLSNHTIIVRGESVSKPLSCTQASDSRDAFVKGIYGRLFMWIVNKINKAIFTPDSENGRRSVGLLDIFGFEHFDTNSFEQLCINFANEHLQQFFVRHIFKLEQEEYNAEQIPWEHIDFSDNQRTLDVIALRPLNIISLIDEESKFPQGTDATMLVKLNNVHSKTNVYIASKSVHDTKFGINHYAGIVYYETEGFLDKNRDLLSTDIMLMIHTSSNYFLKQVFQMEKITKSSGSVTYRHIINSYSQKTADTNRSLPTLGGQFKQSLEQLMKILESCQPYFIRCIKPNEFKKPKMFDRELCIRQLQYSGMMETIRIRKAGYPIRYSFSEFFQRYRVLLPIQSPYRKKENFREGCIDIAKSVIGKHEDWKVGKTKLFLKDNHDTKLEVERDKAITASAIRIQKVVRGYKDRKRFLRQREAAIKIQSAWKSYYCRKTFQKMLHGFQRLQAIIRSRPVQMQYKKKREVIIQLQGLSRGYLLRKKIAKRKNAVLVLQTYTRGMLARKEYRRMKRNEYPSQQDWEEAEKRKEMQKALLLQQEKENLEMVEQVFGFLPAMDMDTSPFSDEIDLDTLLYEPDKEEEYTFPKFAATYFQGSATDTHIRKALQQPLLYHEDKNDVLASLAVWKIILRFMGELPEPALYTPNSSSERSSVLTQIYDTLTRKNNITAGIKDNVPKVNKKGKGKEISSMKLKRASKLAGQVSRQLSNGEEIMLEESSIIDKPMSNLEKIHFIAGNGILRPEIRDEIYCQICKQLSGNNNKTSVARGWILLALCLGCFPPSDKFLRYLQNFIRTSQIAYNAICIKRLNRTLQNGVRSEPPSWLELQAIKGVGSFSVPVTLMTGHSMNIQTDSATNAREMCKVIAQKLQLKDTFGFSVYISVYNKVWSLGFGSEHLMDGISQCEQLAKEQGEQERHSPWRLNFRKEIFTPWHDSSTDSVSTELIYCQVIRGLCFGEYRCDKEQELAELMLKHHYIKYGEVLTDQHVESVMQDCVPPKQLETKQMSHWLSLLKERQAVAQYVKEKHPALQVKEAFVEYSRLQWPLLFSKFFEASKFTGPSISRNHFIVAINWKEINFLDEKEKRLLQLSFPELIGIRTKRAEKTFGQCCILNTLRGEEFVLTSQHSDEIAHLLLYFLDELKARSHYAVALQDSSHTVKESLSSTKKAQTDEPDLLSFRSGDVLLLDRSPELQLRANWIFAKNERTGKTGAVSLSSIHIIPTLSTPSSEILRLIVMSPEERKSEFYNALVEDFEKQEEVKPYTLEEFSLHHFRNPDPESLSRAVLQRSRGKTHLWAYSREPLRQPLLRKVCEISDLRDYACTAFTAIMKYMGDYPSKQTHSPVELTDQIFSGPIKEEALRDEIYCQILKQMTGNSKSYSVNSGWQLLWLCTGLFPPTKLLLVHVKKFIENRQKEPLAKASLRRILRVQQYGARKQPPHLVEVEAIQQMSTKIYHKVYFPNGKEETFEVGTNTKVRELCQNISSKLQLTSWEGFSLFLKIGDKVISQNEQDYFYDSLRQLNDFIRKTRPTAGTPAFASFQLYFMRKLWINVQPGKDIKADCIFHYHQEVPKYMRGYNLCSVEDAVNLAGLMYKVQYNNDRTHLATLNKNVRDLVPEYLLRLSTPEEWKKNIIAAYNKHEAKTVDEAKVAFLRQICRWPTFGSAFFEVKQSSEPSYPDIVLIAINKHGVSLFHPKTKELLITHPFNKISRWNSGNTYFQMTTGSLVRDNKILCETSLGYKMDDLLTSYIHYIMSKHQKNA
ncbi:hypothetical protein XENTR_v10014711 [Xenopus tropicalis]|uniref:Myosin VIIB n=1 Tax=Xenopus tropicalis TaxID=8364 RepID=A0A6I8QMW0_XENTR|nr:unconventional myosin-VIIb [Xenopus tropicalis]KAE8604428.1 hypothetical protein XENTR_v10014711 [Xenopus tropicalis]KAE8604429.1 hypothetical protein XENTR_v10014711 [Xenopus tropicalis]|eukprot:XP_002936659.2 PREDICTED: unconventional myosin-VIIb [Xenopus tropicalis]